MVSVCSIVGIGCVSVYRGGPEICGQLMQYCRYQVCECVSGGPETCGQLMQYCRYQKCVCVWRGEVLRHLVN